MTSLNRLDVVVSQLRADDREALAAAVAEARDELSSSREHFAMIAELVNEGLPKGAQNSCPADDMSAIWSWVSNELELRRSQVKNAHAELGVMRARQRRLVDRDWLQAQTAFYFGQLTSLLRKEGATRQEVLDLAGELTDKIIGKSNADERSTSEQSAI